MVRVAVAVAILHLPPVVLVCFQEVTPWGVGSEASLLRVDGRAAHGPAPVSASLYRLRRQTALLGTVSRSSRGLGGGGRRTALRGVGGLGGWVFPTDWVFTHRVGGARGEDLAHPYLTLGALGWEPYPMPPSSARDTNRPSPITTWSTTEIPTVRPTALSCLVTARSSADGVGSPEGWL